MGTPPIQLTGRRLTAAEKTHMEELRDSLAHDLHAAEGEASLPTFELALRSLPELVAREWVIRCFAAIRVDAVYPHRAPDQDMDGAPTLAVLTHGPGAVLLIDDDPEHPGHPRLTPMPLCDINVGYTELTVSDGSLAAVRLQGPSASVDLAFGPMGYAQFFEFAAHQVQQQDVKMYRSGTPQQTRRDKTVALRRHREEAVAPAFPSHPPQRRPGLLSRLMDAVTGPIDDPGSMTSGSGVGACPLCGDDIENVMEHAHDHVGPIPDEDWDVAYTFHCCDNRLVWPTAMQACAGFTQHLMEHGIDHFANWPR